MESQAIVYIVDDDPDARRALAAIVESMRVHVMTYPNAEEFLSAYREHTPCCLLTDLRMRGMSGLDLLRHLKAVDLAIPTVIITGHAETSIAVDAMLSGAVTFLEKTVPPPRICEAISQALETSIQLMKAKAQRDRTRSVWSTMAQEERKVLLLVAKGKLNKEIAFELGSPIRTVEDRRRRLMQKIGGESVVDLIRFAMQVEDLGLANL